MAKNNEKKMLTEDTVIGSRKISAAEFRKFFEKTLGEDYEKYAVARNVIKVSLSHKGKTLKQIVEECFNPPTSKTLEEILLERRFNIISQPDKDFMKAFDKSMHDLGYDFGGNIVGNKDLMVIVYGKTNSKAKKRPRPACVLIDNDGKASLKLYLHKVDEHRPYIENAPSHIKEIFTSDRGKCIGCNFRNGKCKYNVTKTYTIDGRLFNKCDFTLTSLPRENIPDYIDLLSEFYPEKVKSPE